MIEDAMDIAKRAAALMDDPGMSRFTFPYQQPFIDQCYDILDNELEAAGMQYVESIVEVLIPEGTSDLGYLNDDGQPLATMKYPKSVKWKLDGQPDIEYQWSSGPVEELDEVDGSSSFGALQWRNGRGAIQVTPSITPMWLKIYFDEMSTDIWDPTQNVVRGTGHILAIDVAIELCDARTGMEKKSMKLGVKRAKAWNTFKNSLVKNKQSARIEAQQIHGKRRMGTPYVPA